jgi:hypothetical protein
MRFNPRHLALIAVTAGALVPATAGARPLPADPPYTPAAHDVGITHAAVVCGKDYSRNSVSGDYCTPVSSGAPSVATRPTSSPTQIVVRHDDGFAWGEAGIGAGGALLLGLVAGGGFMALRRRHTPATG